MHPAYFETRFRTPSPVTSWPEEFVILTAWATTGESWTDQENQKADRVLERTLRTRGALKAHDGARRIERVTGFSPTTGHAEPGWAVVLPFDEACDLGELFRQDALYVVRGDALYVSHCDARRRLVQVGAFRDRLEAPRQHDDPADESATLP